MFSATAGIGATQTTPMPFDTAGASSLTSGTTAAANVSGLAQASTQFNSSLATTDLGQAGQDLVKMIVAMLILKVMMGKDSDDLGADTLLGMLLAQQQPQQVTLVGLTSQTDLSIAAGPVAQPAAAAGAYASAQAPTPTAGAAVNAVA